MSRPLLTFVAMASIVFASCGKKTQPALQTKTIRTSPVIDATADYKPVVNSSNPNNSSINSAYRNSRKRVPAK